uniref:Protein SSUH2 homolog n=1 Tax=Sphaeramia orbicularis TaxID=375764 RepID=A0A672YPR3_9TELE
TSSPLMRVPTVSEDVAREALLKFVESKWTYSSKPARNLTFKELKPITVYRYRLETYTETRTSLFGFVTGQPVDGPQFGMSPPPWDIPVSMPQRYTDMVQKIRVPHSSFIKVQLITFTLSCSGCQVLRCTFCHGNGRSRNKRCTSCHGRGRRRCISCHGQGYKTCTVCHGSQNLLHFIELTVTWYVKTVILNHNLYKSSLLHFYIYICFCLCELINEHLNRYSATSRILQQVKKHTYTV